MNELDSSILTALQNDFPVNEKPYYALASKLHISYGLLWSRIQIMKKKGIIRRIGASLDSHNLGFSSTLAAVSVPANKVEKAAKIIGQFREVTHSYLRKDKYNIWFTIIAKDNNRIKSILNNIRLALSLDESEVLNLPAKRLFKLDARFDTKRQ